MSNTKLEANVRDQLLGDASIESSRIKIEAEASTVILSGVVDTLHQKLRAGEDASRLTGVNHVRNDIIIDKSHERVPDADLRATAQAGMDANGLVPKGALTINVADGWITLTGNVRHHYQRRAAEHVARRLTGVQGLTDNLTVSKDPSVDVSEAISAALSRDAAVDAKTVQVTDTGGAVTLSGTVKTFAEKQEAERSASASPGVVAVKNNLVVAS
jgi:osmotically-inducible protein OsmY